MYDNIQELSAEDATLMQKAIEARQNAYAPYSGFGVGAAVLLDNSTIVQGSNQENAAFPSGLCAERVAIYHAMANYPEAKILKIAVSGGDFQTPKNEPVTPCGSCRQSILEYETSKKSPITIFCMGTQGAVLEVQSVRDLLPFCFDELW